MTNKDFVNSTLFGKSDPQVDSVIAESKLEVVNPYDKLPYGQWKLSYENQSLKYPRVNIQFNTEAQLLAYLSGLGANPYITHVNIHANY